MKIVRTFDVSAEEFFDALVAKLRIEIEESSDAPISAEIAAGTVYYARNAAGTPCIRTRISKLERPGRLVIEARDGHERARTEYILEPVPGKTGAEERVSVSFMQDASTFERSLAGKGAVRRNMAELSYLRRMLNGLYSVEKTALDRRRGIEPQSRRMHPSKQRFSLLKGVIHG